MLKPGEKLLFWALLFLVVSTMGCSQKPENVIREYFAALNRHDREAIMGFYAEDYVVESPDMGFRMNRQELGPIIDWDLAVNASFEVEDLKVSGNTVQFTLLENNDFLELTGLPPFRLSCVCIVDGAEIRSQEFRILEGTVDVRPAIAPVVEWAREIYPELIEEIYPNEQLVYTAESARKWIELLREWRSTTDD